MPDQARQALRRMLFDPEGSEYDEATARELIQLMPLFMPKPTEYMGDELTEDNAFEAWVWHPELNDYVKHGGSFDPRTGMMLKGMRHESIQLTKDREEELGNEIYKGKDGRYYSRKKK